MLIFCCLLYQATNFLNAPRIYVCIMLIFCWSFLVGLLYDFQILHIDAQIFQFGSHDVLKIQVY